MNDEGSGAAGRVAGLAERGAVDQLYFDGRELWQFTFVSRRVEQMLGVSVTTRGSGRPSSAVGSGRALYTSGYTQDAALQRGALEPGAQLLSKPYRRADLAEKLYLALARDDAP